MSNLIEVGQESKPPLMICPYCQSEIRIDITIFSNDVTKIFRDNCPKCGGEIFVGIFIIGHRNLDSLLTVIRKVIDSVNTPNIFTG
jgi:Zn-finger nucleic acid-binding protein